MPHIHFSQTGVHISVPHGSTILEAVRKAGMIVDSPCNQTGVCGKCRVRLSLESLHAAGMQAQDKIPVEKQVQGWVQACNTTIFGDIVVDEIPDHTRESNSVLQYGQSTAFPLQPALRKQFDADSNQTLVYADNRCIGRESGNTSERLYGAAIDIGTTTVVACLVNLGTGKELAAASAHNPQSRYAQDVLSRISFASQDGGLQTLKSVLFREINSMLVELCRQSAISAGELYEIVFSGNTCMLHLATGTSPASLGQYPYTPRICGHQSMSAAQLGLVASPLATVYLPPILSAFVGADLTSGILSLRMHRRAGITLLIDIGTNGEIILAEDGRLTATSTAAGPALEGMNISCGMCAGTGAVENVSAGKDHSLPYRTIGNAPAKGLCGSGLIDLVATLIREGVIEESGRFAKPEKLPAALGNRLSRPNGSLVFHLTPEVVLSQKDVRQVQLAKGAIRAGIDQLLDFTGITPAQVDRVLIAGAFGFHLATESLLTLKIFPREFADKVDYVGNTSKTGAQAFLISEPSRQEMADMASQVKILELSGQPDFERHFVRCLAF